MVRKIIIGVAVFIVVFIFTFMFIYAYILANEATRQEGLALEQAAKFFEVNEQLVKSISELQTQLDSTQSQLKDCMATK